MAEGFPADFVWGVSTSAYQIEGAVRAGGRGESIWDRFARTPGNVKDDSSGDVACDHYRRCRDDIELMRELGITAYNFSVAWPRVIPGGAGQVNPDGLGFYDRLVDMLLEAGIIPFLKLYHWDLPQALQDRGGWDNRDTAYVFADYADVVARCLGDRVTYWITHLEPWVVAFMGHYQGVFAPGVKNLRVALQVAHHLLLSHGLAVPAIRQWVSSDAQVGISPNLCPAYPASDKEVDDRAARRFDGYFNRWFLDPLARRGYPEDMWEYYGTQVPEVVPGDLDIIAVPIDFLGVNYYNRAHVVDDLDGPVPGTRDVDDPTRQRTADREIYPEGLYDTLWRLHQEYPFEALYITENGAAFSDEMTGDGRVHDKGRIEFLATHLAQAARALEDGVGLEGYFVWSLMDNFEWAQGYTQRYGITHVDYTTQARTMKDSGYWYRDFIAGDVGL